MWPEACALCAAATPDDRGICDGCRTDLAWLTHSCRHCALALAPNTATTVCRHCQRAPAFDRAVAACHYDEAMAWLVGSLKFRGRIAHARVLARLLTERLASTDGPGCDLLLPVPLHAASFRRRGFNQAERIAHHLGARLGVPVAVDGLRRVRDTRRQSTLSVAERAANVRGAFACDRDLTGARVAIVDDVITTTRTARSVAAVARAAGAAHVMCLAPARA
ncbi:MAG: amidophosphoribosyltransferase [Xanthomonadales bacterium]|nr:amidophosphoribosyltransferase [Xanthomonadales bacterium]